MKPFVKGHAASSKRQLTEVVSLAVAYVVSATFIVFVVSSLAPLVRAVTTEQMLFAGAIVACSIGIVVDVWAMRRRALSFGLPRQTPKALLYLGEHAWIAPIVWGLDTGLIWTTFRVSFTSWILLFMAATGLAPAWSGVVYGLAFALPFLWDVVDAKPILVPRKWISSLAVPQTLGIGAMALTAVTAGIAWVWPA